VIAPVVAQKHIIVIRRHSVSYWFEQWSKRKKGTPQT
jgi:hypothetical protein